MVRRRVAAGVGVVLLIVIVLIVNGCLKSQKTQALKEYTHNVSTIVTESDQQVSQPLFAALSDASAKSALDVEDAGQPAAPRSRRSRPHRRRV